MFRLITTVKRGVASDLDGALGSYETLDAAREAAQSLGKHEIVSTVMITSDEVPPSFVEWAVY
jgi:hypothetical protein